MRQFISTPVISAWGGRPAAAGSAALAGTRVYLAGPRTCLDPEGHALLEAALLDLGVVDVVAHLAFPAAARALRAHGAQVTSPFEASWWRGSDASLHNLRAERERDALALETADLVVVLDGWEDVPGAVDTAILVAETRGVPWAQVSAALAAAELIAEELAAAELAATGTEAPLRRRAS
jgi:hypothetical protein